MPEQFDAPSSWHPVPHRGRAIAGLVCAAFALLGTLPVQVLAADAPAQAPASAAQAPAGKASAPAAEPTAAKPSSHADAASASTASAAEAPEVPAELPPPVFRPAPKNADEALAITRRALAMRDTYAREVTRRLTVPAAAQREYAARLQQALAAKGHGDLAGEYVVLVDRARNVQALFVYFRTTPGNEWQLIGASPVGTGLPGQYDHFVTPTGVFEHSPVNMDFRAEGTENENKIRGYGAAGRRIFDFGWVDGQRGWGKGGTSPMRFQMHATDPDKLEPLLGIRHSKGCVRIPGSLNAFLDHRGILDADYETRASEGEAPWILHDQPREPTPDAGRYLVVIDTAKGVRPAWSPLPGRAAWSKLPKGGDTAD
ncbi:L,D-transpeptidase [Burkholderia gladioli]|uniref:L,D-transpeptidase n=1 Tax=Burkholderia gladioli TaxID=28095 RepID=UPI001641CE11|nr:L,D-transpeptidase [Burkholderia gladioli]